MTYTEMFAYYVFGGWPFFTALMLYFLAENRKVLTVMDLLSCTFFGLMPFMREFLLITLSDITDKVIWRKKNAK